MLIVISLILEYTSQKKYPSSIDGIHINALDLINQTFVSNKHLNLLKAEIIVYINGNEIDFTYRYFGKVSKKMDEEHQGVFFNFSSEANDEQNHNIHVGYDLNTDLNYEHPIEMLLKSPRGMSKCLFLPFQKTLNKNDNFNVEIKGEIHNPLPSNGTTYYFVKFSFDDKYFKRKNIDYSFCMCFNSKPLWVNSNIINKKKELIKMGRLDYRFNEKSKKYVYHDNLRKSSSSDIHVYTFERT